jgi:transcriptional regulator with XRE-family HTH domain
MSTITPMPQPSDSRSIIASEIRSLMGRYSRTQGDLADLLEVSQTQVSRRLRGIIPFDSDELMAVANYFGVSVGYLFGESTNPRLGGPDGGIGADDETRTRNILLGRQSVTYLSGVSSIAA